MSTGDFTWQMGAKAARQAVTDAGISGEEIDLVIVSTCTGDYLTPSTSCLIANDLHLKNPACFDINCACAGFVSAVDMAEKYLSAGEYRTALVVSSEMLTKMVDYTDRSTCVLFGDGAGACIIKRSEALFASHIGSDPASGCHIFARGIAPSNQFREVPFDPLSDGLPPTNGSGLHQDGQDVYKFATRAMPAAIREACKKAGLSPEELDWVFPHQANYRIIETAAKNLKLPMGKCFVNIETYGNISSACIPVGLAEAKADGRLSPGDRICIVGFGGGLVYAAAVFEW